MLSVYGCSNRPEEAYLLEWKLQVFVYCLIWVLGTELWFSGRPISALNCRIFSPDAISFWGGWVIQRSFRICNVKQIFLNMLGFVDDF